MAKELPLWDCLFYFYFYPLSLCFDTLSLLSLACWSTTERSHQGEEVLIGRAGERREAALGQRQTLKGNVGGLIEEGFEFVLDSCV